MDQSSRSILTGSIYLQRITGGTPEEYRITSMIGEGGSTVCYEATRINPNGEPETGRLKEFYPQEYDNDGQSRFYSMIRLKNGRLVPGSGTVRSFEKLCREYLSAYELLNRAIAKNKNNEILKNFIQLGERLDGVAPSGMGLRQLIKKDSPETRRSTVYIWSSGVPGQGFDSYLREVRRNPTRSPEKRLLNILKVIHTLTDFTKALHTAGLLHLDLNPSNFLVQYDSDFEIVPDGISVFDINTLRSMADEPNGFAGTTGFSAPEIRSRFVDHHADIYSIGAILFHAIVINDEDPDGLYRGSVYDNIEHLLRNSELIRYSDTTSNAALMSKLCKILKNCLNAKPESRYESCSCLRNDLDRAISCLNKLIQKPMDMPKEGSSDTELVLQKLLYEHPLFDALPDIGSVPVRVQAVPAQPKLRHALRSAAPAPAAEVPAERNLNVLVLGAGDCGQRFIDICLRSCQMDGVLLNITAVSNDSQSNKEDYLRFRHALPEYVNVDGSMSAPGLRPYANLRFRSVAEFAGGGADAKFVGSESPTNQTIIENLLNAGPFHYVFVALGEDKLSQGVACQIGNAQPCPVAYISQKKGRKPKDASANVLRVWINESVDLASIDRNLGEMAFNAHLSWCDTLQMDVAKERRLFLKDKSSEWMYPRRSSLAFVLALKYYLKSVNIELDDPIRAAGEFSTQVLGSGKDGVSRDFNRLVVLEHRRWLLDRAIDGWSAPRGNNGELMLEDCITRASVKDFANCTHPCMVRGDPDVTPLYRRKDRTIWDAGDISDLDELDQMSVRLHRCFKQRADEFLKNSGLQDSSFSEICDLIRGCEKAELAFREFRFALKNIRGGSEKYSRQYRYYHDAFLDSIKELPKDKQESIRMYTELIKHKFFPVVESNLFRDYKYNDAKLIEAIPFILSYRCPSCLALAFADGISQNGRNNAGFGNVAAATVLHPEKILYLYHCTGKASIKPMFQKLDGVLCYFGKRNLSCGVDLVVSHDESFDYADIQTAFDGLKTKYQNAIARPESLTLLEAASIRDAAEQHLITLSKNYPDLLFDGCNPLFSSVFDNKTFLDLLLAAKIPYIEYDPKAKAFTHRIGCDYLNYWTDSCFLRVSDMFALMNAEDRNFNMPEFSDDYTDLWRIYTGQNYYNPNFSFAVRNWNKLCQSLADYENNHPSQVALFVSAATGNECTLTRFYAPGAAGAVKDLLEQLKKARIAKASSQLVSLDTEYRLDLTADSAYAGGLASVLDREELQRGAPLTVSKYYNKDKQECISVMGNFLQVNHLEYNFDNPKDNTRCINLLNTLKRMNYIRSLDISDNSASGKVADPSNPPRTVSFEYTRARNKDILTCAGTILEVYTYYEALKTGYFDDVACGYEFFWEDGNVQNELDLVLTKGFRSIIVECKAVQKLEQDYYHKLHSIAEHFGIGTIMVLLGNTYADGYHVENRLQRSRGDQLNIVTISDENDIKNIGKKLVELMEQQR